MLWRRRPARRRRRRRSGNASAFAPAERGDCVHGPLTSVQRPGDVCGSPPTNAVSNSERETVRAISPSLSFRLPKRTDAGRSGPPGRGLGGRFPPVDPGLFVGSIALRLVNARAHASVTEVWGGEPPLGHPIAGDPVRPLRPKALGSPLEVGAIVPSTSGSRPSSGDELADPP